MRTFIDTLRKSLNPQRCIPDSPIVWGIAVLLAIGVSAQCQSPVPDQSASPSQSSAQSTPAPRSQAEAAVPTTSTEPERNAKDHILIQGAFSVETVGGAIKEDQLRQLLVGKTMYLRAGYQNNNLEFDEHGQLQGHSPQGSFTLSQVQINKVKLSKHKLELEGDRYALHFLGAAPYEDPTAATDRVKINPKKKTVRIWFVREEVEKPKKKEKNEDKKQRRRAKNENTETAGEKPPSAGSDHSNPASASSEGHGSGRKEELAKSDAQSSQLLLSALDAVFSVGIDQRMIAAMPEFWKLYYQAAAEKTDYKPADPGVFRSGIVDQKAKLVSAIDPPSNEFAQANGVAGIALYHAVVGSDGKVEEVVAGRPIGFGLDESAAETIRKATFQPAMKDGKPVPVSLDLVVSFRIYSKRTSQPSAAVADQKPDAPVLPGPYTLEAKTALTAGQVH